jgi:hypothetical protein
MVEFALVLPFLLFLLFGIIEFGRLLWSYMAVQNAARFGVRYAITGERNNKYCEEAANALGLAAADRDADGNFDCKVPRDYTGGDPEKLTNQITDYARLPSIRDEALVGATALLMADDAAVQGNYLSYLANRDNRAAQVPFLGQPTSEGYFRVMICSNRDTNEDSESNFAVDNSTYDTSTCYEYFTTVQDKANGRFMDDAGGPGDRVRVTVSYVHPVIVPLLTMLYPNVPLSVYREGIVEKFRSGRISGIRSGGGIVPTNTPSPTKTHTPTRTNTSTYTPTPTATDTATSTPTFTPTDTSTPTITPTATPTPSCELFSNTNLVLGENSSAYFMYQNENTFPVRITNFNFSWAGPWHDEVNPTPGDNYLLRLARFGHSVQYELPDQLLVPGLNVPVSDPTNSFWLVAANAAEDDFSIEFSYDFLQWYSFYHAGDFTVSLNFIVDVPTGNDLSCTRTITGLLGPRISFNPTPPIPAFTNAFNVRANAIDPDPGGNIEYVRFYVYDMNGNPLGNREDRNSPYCLFSGCNARGLGQFWPDDLNQQSSGAVPIQNGTYRLVALAKDYDDTYLHNTRIQTTISINMPTPTPSMTPTSTPTPCPANGNGLQGSYYNYTGSSVAFPPGNPRLVRNDANVNFNWGNGSPDPVITTDRFIVRWVGQVMPRYPNDTITFITRSDDGMRVWVNGTRVANHWANQSASYRNGDPITLGGCNWVNITVEYYENSGSSVAQLYWSSVRDTNRVIVDQAHLLLPVAPTLQPTGYPATSTPTATGLPTNTPMNTNTPTITLTPTTTNTARPTPTYTPTDTATPLPTATNTRPPTNTPLPTNTPGPNTATPTPTPTATPRSAKPTNTPSGGGD